MSWRDGQPIPHLLEKWFKLFSEYEHDDLYIAGELYAGQYIPYIAPAILGRNKNATAAQDDHVWNIKGLLIGNGWIGAEQYQAYLSFTRRPSVLNPNTWLVFQSWTN